MAAVKIRTGLDGGENSADIPREQWRELVRTRRTCCQVDFRQDCRRLVFFIEDAAKNSWLGFGTRENYVREGLGLDLDLVPWAIEGLQKLDPQNAVSFDEAVVLGQRGGDRKSEKARADQPNNVSLKTYGNSPAYTLARLKRDRPDLADKVVKGELTANAAAIIAGFRRATWSAPADPEQLAAAIVKRYPDWRLIRQDHAH